MSIKINRLVCDWCSKSIDKLNSDVELWTITKAKNGKTRVFCPEHDTHEKRMKQKK